ncbi:MAG TPA: hypothetical protein VFR41_02030 [Acidimicrobiia bacterium]|nr:hypothetical protein [Acidimicrobiia bacterium]
MRAQDARIVGWSRRTRFVVAILVSSLVVGAASCGPRATPSRYGVVLYDTTGLDLMRDASFKWVRLYVKWDAMQPSAAHQFDPGYLAWIDSQVNAAVKFGFSVDITFERHVPSWAWDPTQTQSQAGTGTCDVAWRAERRPASPSMFHDFAYETVRHFRDRVASWELWNEPWMNCRWPGNAADFRNLVFGPGFDGIREAEPGAIVLGPSVNNGTQFSNFYKDSSGHLVRLVNAVNLHQYGSVTDIESAMDVANKFHPCTTAGYCVRKYELTEYGFGEAADPDNAKMITRHCEAQTNCERLYYFIQVGQGLNAQGDPYGSYALLDNNGVPRAKYWSLRAYQTSQEPPLPQS